MEKGFGVSVYSRPISLKYYLLRGEFESTKQTNKQTNQPTGSDYNITYGVL